MSRITQSAKPMVGWCFALACCLYVLSPIDLAPELVLGPFGLFDDAGALVAGIYAAMTAARAGKPLH